MSQTSNPTLTATYAAPSKDSQTFTSSPLPTLVQNHTFQDKTAYLSALGSATKNMQNEVNDFLTRKMEEDNANKPAAGANTVEQKEEDMYGEEGEE